MSELGTKEDESSDEHWLRVFSMMARPALEWQCLVYMRQAELNAETVRTMQEHKAHAFGTLGEISL